jgi:hypothetical protein
LREDDIFPSQLFVLLYGILFISRYAERSLYAIRKQLSLGEESIQESSNFRFEIGQGVSQRFLRGHTPSLAPKPPAQAFCHLDS